MAESKQARAVGPGHPDSARDASSNEDVRLLRERERLAAELLYSASFDDLLQRSLGVLLQASGFDLGVVRTREGDFLRARAALGIESEVTAGFQIPLADAPTDGARIVRVAEGAPGRSDQMLRRGVRALYCLPLLASGELLGATYLGACEDRELSSEDAELLCALAEWIAIAGHQKAASEALARQLHARDEVLSVVAHDLRNPLNVIGLAANSLLQRLTDSSARRTVERITRSVQRGNRLIRDLLDISAIENGRFVVEPRVVETADLILAGLESQQVLAANASVIIAADLSPELPPIEADEERILEVLENLISNAVKFTAPGGTITVGATARENDILFWVKDTGVGIPPEQLPRLFDRFWQARSADRRGLGLGLTICKAIVDAHGGRIWAESRLESGTSVFFTLPSRPERRRAAERGSEIANILLVDDRPENLTSLASILDRPDYRVVTATSGEQALSLALRQEFAVALIDVAMPGMNGLEVAVHLKELERSRDIPIIFVTAFGDDPEEIHRAYSAGGADYLVKPLDAEIVRKKVAVFVDLSRRRHGNDDVTD